MIYEYPQTFTPLSIRSRGILLSLASYFDFVVPVPCASCREYFLPYEDGDKFWFQFNQTVNTVELKDEHTDAIINPDGVTIDGKQFSIDTSLLPPSLACFYVVVNGDCRLTHGYEKAKCKETVLIEGLYENGRKDIQGNSYLNGYSNRLRIYADLEYVGDEIEEKTVNDIKTAVIIRDLYELRPTVLINNNSWLLKHLLKSVLRAPTIKATFGNNTYLYETLSDGVEKGNDLSDKWHPVITLKTVAKTQDLIC